MAKDTFNLSKDDFQGGYKTAPGGTYRARITPKSDIKPSKSSDGNNLQIQAVITEGPHKGVNFFDTIAPHVGWKVAQIISALELEMKKGTLQALLSKAKGKEVRVILREEEWKGRMKNKVVQWLPLDGPVTSGEDTLDEEFPDEDFGDEDFEDEFEDELDEDWEDEFDEDEFDEDEWEDELDEFEDEDWEDELDEEDWDDEDFEDELDDFEEEASEINDEPEELEPEPVPEPEPDPQAEKKRRAKRKRARRKAKAKKRARRKRRKKASK